MHVFKDLLDADPSLIADFDQRVLGYFPDKIQAKYAEQVSNHMLKTSIGMTVLLNEVWEMLVHSCSRCSTISQMLVALILYVRGWWRWNLLVPTV